MAYWRKIRRHTSYATMQDDMFEVFMAQHQWFVYFEKNNFPKSAAFFIEIW